jgi:hypothetical protein
MQRMKYLLKILFTGLILISVIKCSQDEPDVLNHTDLIFHNSLYLKIRPYKYFGDEGKEYFCQGDTIFYTTIADTFDSRPVIQWDSVINFDILSVAIFTAPIIVKDNNIKNTNDIIWRWNSGMVFEKYWSIKYNEGKRVYNGNVDYEHAPDPLNKGQYYWAVWGWNPEGTKILYSTRQMSFNVQ